MTKKWPYILLLGMLFVSTGYTHASLSSLLKACRSFYSLPQGRIFSPMGLNVFRELQARSIRLIDVDLNMLEQRNPHGFVAGGVQNNGTYVGKYHGRDLLVKVVTVSEEFSLRGFIHQVELNKRLFTLGLSPRLYGVVDLGGNQFGMVLDFIYPSQFLKPYLNIDQIMRENRLLRSQVEEAREHIRHAPEWVQNAWRRKINRMPEVLNRIGLFAVDLQVLLTPHGDVFLIDLEQYFYSNNEHTLETNELNFEHLLNVYF